MRLFLLASANGGNLALSASLGKGNRSGRGKKFPKGASQNSKKKTLKDTNQQRKTALCVN